MIPSRHRGKTLRAAGALAVFGCGLLLPGTPVRAGKPAPEVAVSPDSLRAPDWSAFHLRRATAELHQGNVRRARDLLRQCDLRTPDAFPDADRAAYLLARTSLELGDGQGFLTVAGRVAGWTEPTPFTRWIGFLRLLERSAPDGALEPDTAGTPEPAYRDLEETFRHADALTLSWLLRRGRPEEALRFAERAGSTSLAVATLRAAALDALGRPSEDAWKTVSGGEARDPWDPDLIGAACLRLAERRLEAGGDPEPALARVPAGSRYAVRARHLLAVVRSEREDPGNAEDNLLALWNEEHRTDHRPIGLRLGGWALESGHPDTATAMYRDVDADWRRDHDRLLRLADAGGAAADTLWTAWEREGFWPQELTWDAAPGWTAADSLAARALDLRNDPPARDLARQVTFDVPGGAAGIDPPVPPPAPQDRDAVRRARAAARQGAADLQAAQARLRDLETGLRHRGAYLDRGLALADSARADLDPVEHRIDAILADLDATLGRLRSLRDEATRRFVTRATALEARAQAHRVWIRSLRHWYVGGANRPDPAPDGGPDPAALLDREERLADALDTWARGVEAGVPGLLERSLDQAWTPRVAGQARALHERLATHGDRLAAFADSVRGARDGLAADPELLALGAEVARLQARADSLDDTTATLARRVAAGALQRALAALDAEREGIDYGLTAATYERAVRTIQTGGDILGDSASVALRTEARDRLQAFLDTYPDSPARGESRFRLADLLLVRAKEAFDAKMQRFLSGDMAEVGSGSRSLVPYVNYGPALALYRKILADDAGYPHRDAVLFHLGMILSDQGDAASATYLSELVRDYPTSPFCQEATLRMGDDAFDRSRFAACVPLYEQAAAGPDPALTAIALYRMGWAHFREDRFEAATDAFRRLLDHYAEYEAAGLKTDLRAEAENYLIHSLARGGGAPFFEAYFSKVGPRPYESRLLWGLAALLRKFSLYPETIAADRLYLERYGDTPAALASARRLVDCYDQGHRPAEARDARLDVAARFLPGSRWYAVNEVDSLRTEAETFSRGAIESVALYFHHRARDGKGGPEAWRRALDLYGQLLEVWPTDARAARIHLYAGEAAAHLQEYADALSHYETAVALFYAHEAGVEPLTAPDSDLYFARITLSPEIKPMVLDADWQRVAVSDAWYRSTVGSTSGSGSGSKPGLGSDSLAVRVHDAALGFATRHPGDPRAPDALWRGANLVLAHGWNLEAASDFGVMARKFPADRRAPRAATLRGDALFEAERFGPALDAYREALDLCRAAGVDSLVSRIQPVLPLCAYRQAEAAAADSTQPAQAASLFEAVARTWPDYEHAGLALYRAGLAYTDAAKTESAIAAWERLLERYPKHPYAKDAHLQIAAAWEKAGNPVQAAAAYRRVSEAYPQDPQAGDALLKAADLLESAADSAGAEGLRLDYVDRFPDDVETGMGILQKAARRELDSLAPGAPVSALLTPAKGKHPSRLAAYLALAEAHPEMAGAALRARVQFLRGEEALPAYRELAITLPIDVAIRKKKKSMERVLTLYGGCAQYGDPEWSRAAAHRIGRVMIDFGRALEASERPAELTGDDLAAYDEVLNQEAWSFYDQGEAVWSKLLEETRTVDTDPGGWIAATRQALWPRLAERFYCMPEVEYPLLHADGPQAVEPAAPVRSEVLPGTGGSGTGPGGGTPPQTPHKANEDD